MHSKASILTFSVGGAITFYDSLFLLQDLRLYQLVGLGQTEEVVDLLHSMVLQSGASVPQVPRDLSDEVRIVGINHLPVFIELGFFLSHLRLYL